MNTIKLFVHCLLVQSGVQKWQPTRSNEHIPTVRASIESAPQTLGLCRSSQVRIPMTTLQRIIHFGLKLSFFRTKRIFSPGRLEWQLINRKSAALSEFDNFRYLLTISENGMEHFGFQQVCGEQLVR